MTQEKEAIVAFLNHYLSLVVIIGGVVVLVWLLALLYEWNTKKEVNLLDKIGKYVLPLGFFITLGASFLTLLYSDYLGVLPCDLCWYQRIFLYPQVFLFALAWYRRDTRIFGYTLLLSTIGFVIALYHHIMQLGYDVLRPCSTSPFAIDCAKPTFIEYGFVTFPFMGVVLFAILILLSLHNRKRV